MILDSLNRRDCSQYLQLWTSSRCIISYFYISGPLFPNSVKLSKMNWRNILEACIDLGYWQRWWRVFDDLGLSVGGPVDPLRSE